jgi:hypothetical protein
MDCRGSARKSSAGQVRQAQLRAGRQRVGRSQGDQQRLSQQRLGIEAVAVERAEHQPDVSAAVSQRLRLLSDSPEDQLRRQGGLSGGVSGEDLRQQAPVEIGLERNPKPRRLAPGSTSRGTSREST